MSTEPKILKGIFGENDISKEHLLGDDKYVITLASNAMVERVGKAFLMASVAAEGLVFNDFTDPMKGKDPRVILAKEFVAGEALHEWLSKENTTAPYILKRAKEPKHGDHQRSAAIWTESGIMGAYRKILTARGGGANGFHPNGNGHHGGGRSGP